MIPDDGPHERRQQHGPQDFIVAPAHAITIVNLPAQNASGLALPRELPYNTTIVGEGKAER